MKNGKLERRHLETDVLIIGGGTAGCYAAIRLGAEKDLRVLVVEKANIERSGCLAAGVNALNAYISNGHTPADYVEYARRDAEDIIRDDLMMTIAESVNAVTEDLERRGLVILKDAEAITSRAAGAMSRSMARTSSRCWPRACANRKTSRCSTTSTSRTSRSRMARCMAPGASRSASARLTTSRQRLC